MKYSYDEKCLDLARYFYPNQSIAFLEALAQAFQDCVEGREDTDDQTLPIPDFLRNQENLRAERAAAEKPALCLAETVEGKPLERCSQYPDCPCGGPPGEKPACCEGPQKIGPGYHAPYCATMAGTEFAKQYASEETSGEQS